MSIMTEKKVVPKLRFREFNDMYNLSNFGNEVKLFNGYAFSSNDSTKKGVKWVKIADVGINVMKTNTPSYLPLHYKKDYEKFLLHEGDYVVALTRPILTGKLKIAKINSHYNSSLLNQRVGKLESENDLDYIYFFLQRDIFISKIENRISGSEPPNLSPSEISSLKIFLPEALEQQKIASFLNNIEEKLKQLTKKKELLEDYKKGIMQKIFSQEIRFKDNNGNNYPNWEEKELANVFDVVSGKSKSKYLSNNGDYVLVDMGGISSFPRLIANKKTDYCGDFLTTNDLVMPKDDIGGGFIIGKVVGIPKNNKYICGDHVFKLTIKSGHILYFKYAINSFIINKSLRIKANGTAQIGLRKGDVENQILFVPHIQEQKKIANFLSSIDKKIDLVSTQIEKTKEFKKGLLQQMFV